MRSRRSFLKEYRDLLNSQRKRFEGIESKKSLDNPVYRSNVYEVLQYEFNRLVVVGADQLIINLINAQIALTVKKTLNKGECLEAELLEEAIDKIGKSELVTYLKSRGSEKLRNTLKDFPQGLVNAGKAKKEKSKKIMAAAAGLMTSPLLVMAGEEYSNKMAAGLAVSAYIAFFFSVLIYLIANGQPPVMSYEQFISSLQGKIDKTTISLLFDLEILFSFFVNGKDIYTWPNEFFLLKVQQMTNILNSLAKILDRPKIIFPFDIPRIANVSYENKKDSSHLAELGLRQMKNKKKSSLINQDLAPRSAEKAINTKAISDGVENISATNKNSLISVLSGDKDEIISKEISKFLEKEVLRRSPDPN